jgi:hypothetical protein
MKSNSTDEKQGVVGTQEYAAEDLQSEEWLAARRVVASTTFIRSPFLKNFLLYVCDRKLCGREDEISEYQIGVRALGRPSSYHPGEDNIVRNYARMLRKRLEEYFANEGKREPIRITIPRGHYVPIFEPNILPAAHSYSAMAEAVEDAVFPPAALLPEAPREGLGGVRWLWIAAGVLAVCLSVLWGYRVHRDQSVNLYQEFWREMFESGRPSYIVTGDSGFAMVQEITGREIGLHEYVTGEFKTKFPDLSILQGQNGSYGVDRFVNFTSTADLNIVVGLSRLPQFADGQVKVRYARDMRMDDMNQANVILIGGRHANPWVELFEPASQFRMEFPTHLNGLHIDDRAVVNKHPRQSEQAIYPNQVREEPFETYTVLSYLPSVGGIGHALLLQGQNMAGTQAAGDFVMKESAMAPILRKAQRHDGSIGPFEVLLATHTVGASAPEAHPIIERYGNPEHEPM